MKQITTMRSLGNAAWFLITIASFAVFTWGMIENIPRYYIVFGIIWLLCMFIGVVRSSIENPSGRG